MDWIIIKLRVKRAFYDLRKFNIYILFISILIGFLGGLGAVIFRYTIHLFRSGIFQPLFKDLIILSPALGGFLTGWIIYKYAPEAKGHGIPQVMDSVMNKFGITRKRVAFMGILAASINIASGGSAGREGPIGQIGGSLASLVSQILRIRPRDMQLLVIAGLVAGISGTFNAPIGALLFGLEIFRPRFEASCLIPLIMASVIGKITASYFLGDYPAFIIPKDIGTIPLNEYPVLILFTAVISLLGALWVKVFDTFEDRVERLPLPLYVKTALSGLLVGLLALPYPDYDIILGVGYKAIDLYFSGLFGEWDMLTVGFLKMIATILTVGSGATGGIFAPSLTIGAMLGGGLSGLLEEFSPELILDPRVYSLIGMASFFTSVAKVPLTTLIMVPEMTGNYALFAPLMLGNAISYIVSLSILGKESIYTLKLRKIMK